MFPEARLKLTGWYLFIIMLISMFFSAVIYATITKELERGFRLAEMRLKAERLGIPLPRQLPRRFEELGPQLVEDLKTAKKRVVLNLLIVNGLILGFSTTAGYFLAGKTLKPIEEAMEEQKRFVADASHELRTPLTALKTSMEVVLRDKKMSVRESKKVIQSNLEDVDGLQSLTNNLLTLARYDANGNNLIFENINLKDIIEKACKEITPLAKKKNIEIELKLQDCSAQADKDRLKEVMLILLDNGVKYSHKGSNIKVALGKENKRAVIRVKDNGVGIDEKDMPYIFDRFYRADQSRSKTKTDGFGLGLSVAKKIIKQHKGSISVKSKVGKGTTFTIKLPLKYS